MRFRRSFVPAVCAAVLLALPACHRERLPADVRAVLDGAEEIELYSLDPDHNKPKGADTFHGWNVLGKVTLTDRADRSRVVTALKRGVNASDGMVAACFIPRHGIKASHAGKTLELVICFQCLSMKAHVDGKQHSVLTTGSPAAVFNEVLKEKGVKLPEQPR
jgi:hypothetical protein